MSAWQSTQLRESQHDLSVHTAFWTRRKRPACRHGSPPSFESPNITFLFTQLSGLGENAQHVGMAVHPASRVPAPPFCSQSFLDSAKTHGRHRHAGSSWGPRGLTHSPFSLSSWGKRAEVKLRLIQRLLIFDAKVVLGQSA